MEFFIHAVRTRKTAFDILYINTIDKIAIIAYYESHDVRFAVISHLSYL